MSAAIIAMTILGCNDAVTECRYVATADKTWQTIADCNAASEGRVQRYVNVPYPTVIAVCEAPPAPAVAGTPTVPAQAVAQENQKEPLPGFAARIAAEVRAQLPSGTGLKRAVTAPVHFVSDGYSWMARHLGT